METGDTLRRQSAALPSIGFLDSEKIKREEAEYQRRNAAAAMVSPSFPYSHPPPPYSHSHTANAAPVSGQGQGQSGLISPPESRRTSGDSPQPVLPARQSLPSIHEALGHTDPSMASYPPPPASGPPTSTLYYQQTPASGSISDLHHRSYTTAPPPPPSQESRHAYNQPPSQSPYMPRPPSTHTAPHTPTTTADILSRPPLYTTQPKLPTLQPIRTEPSPATSIPPSLAYNSHPQQQSPAYSDRGSHSAPSTATFAGSGNYGQFAGSQPPFSFSQPTSAGPEPYSSHPPASYPPPPPSWRTGPDMRPDDRQRMPYGDSVKRHLDNFDLEASLNEIAESSGRLLEFSRQYGSHAHNNQRGGQNPQSIPPLQVVDELMQKSRKIQDSLFRIRDVVIAQTAAIEEQIKDSNRNMSNGYAPDLSGYSDEGKGSGGFAGPDTKKRRGRAAPPGRCHSCNRAETPEWRRGPDGARTLCNACGLHYAKLTRKLGNNKGVIGNSNLRPKSMGPGSPPA